MKKRGQATLELFARYAWVLLGVLIMIGALSYFGILSPKKLLGDKCSFGSEIGCTEYVIGSNGVQLRLRNNAGTTIVVDDVIVSTKKTQLSCSSSIIGAVWGAGEIKDIPVVCGFADAGLAEGEKEKLDLEITYHAASASSAYSKIVQGEVFAVMGSEVVSGFSVFDTFDTKDSSIWVYNSFQTVPFDDNGNNVVRNIGTSTNWNANFYRSALSLSDGDLAQVEFKVDATDTSAHFAIEAWNPAYNRWAVIATNRIYVQYKENGGAWQYPKTLINPIKTNTWYTIILRVDDNNQFYIKVYEKDNPSIFGNYLRTMPAGLNWRFHHWIYRNTAYIDNYFET